MKKLVIYKLMGSNFILDNAVGGVSVSYKVLGKTLTNGIINRSAGSVFTSGEDTTSLIKDIKLLKSRGILGIGNYVVEGLASDDDSLIDPIEKYILHSIDALCQDGETGHLAVKLSSMLSIDGMTKLSDA